MANQSTIVLPVSLGDTIYKKSYRVVRCRYFGDEYADEDGQPNCAQHEYDCDFSEFGGEGCDAIFEAIVKPVIVDEIILLNFATEIICEKSQFSPDCSSKCYLFSEDDAKSWVEQQNKIQEMKGKL